MLPREKTNIVGFGLRYPTVTMNDYMSSLLKCQCIDGKCYVPNVVF